MTDNNIICKKQTYAAVKITDNIKSKNIKTNHTQINKVSKTDKFIRWKQIFNSEFTHFTLCVLNILNNNTKSCLMKRNLFFIEYILKHIFNNIRFVAVNFLQNHISLIWLLMQSIITCMHIKNILSMYFLHLMWSWMIHKKNDRLFKYIEFLSKSAYVILSSKSYYVNWHEYLLIKVNRSKQDRVLNRIKNLEIQKQEWSAIISVFNTH